MVMGKFPKRLNREIVAYNMGSLPDAGDTYEGFGVTIVDRGDKGLAII